jgi:acyl CoA:acetate/3-ketoacid CoA transferase alpha subunit
MINKEVKSIDEAIKGVQSNMTFMLGGFGLCGIPENCIEALSNSGLTGLLAYQIMQESTILD